MGDREFVDDGLASGGPIFDADDVEVFIALAHIKALLEVGAARRRSTFPHEMVSAAQRHLWEFGHPLEFGCCRDRER